MRGINEMTQLSKSQSLFELDSNLETLLEMLHDFELNTDMDEEEKKFLKADIELALEITEKDKQKKLVGYCNLLSMIEGHANTIDSRIKQLQALKSAKKRIKDRLKNAMLESMNKFGETKIDLVEYKVSLRNSQRVEVPEFEKLDPDYQRQKITVEPDKVKIKADLKAGKAVTGAYLSNNQSVVIK
jgi:hypothetical protein